MTEQTKPPTLTPAEVQNEIVNDSLGTVDPADTTDTDPKDDPAAIADSAQKGVPHALRDPSTDSSAPHRVKRPDGPHLDF